MAYFFETIQTSITTRSLQSIAERYNLPQLSPEITIFGGWQNANVLFTAGNKQYVLRIYQRRNKSNTKIKHELNLLQALAYHWVPVATAIPNSRGNAVETLLINNQRYKIVLFPYLGGVSFLTLNKNQLHHIGSFMANLHIKLADLQKPEHIKNFDIQSEFAVLAVSDLGKTIQHWHFPDTISKNQCKKYFTKDMELFPSLFARHEIHKFERQLIHGDVHQRNLKFGNGKIVGIFDFDEMTCAPKIVDIAIAVQRIYLNQKARSAYSHPRKIADALLSGYQQVYVLSEYEKKFLEPLVKFFFWYEIRWLLKGDLTPEQLQYHQKAVLLVIQGIRKLSY